MPTVHVNQREVQLGEHERLNAIQAAQRAGVEIPHYCWHPALSVVASCRMCLVEVGDRKPDGSVVMQPKLLPACQTPVKEGTVIIADSPKVKAAQEATLEYLLLNHPLDCPVCDQAGECFLQDYSYRFGKPESRLREPKLKKKDKTYIGEQITLFTDRCVMCSRCVRFTREVSGTAELQIIQRGSHAEIDIFPGEPCNNKLAGNVVDLCPVGALCSKDFLYKQRVWWLNSKRSVCPNCSTGCSIHVDQNEDHVYRLRPRANPLAQGHFMCDEGRFGFKYIHDERRLRWPQVRTDGELVNAAWEQVLPALRAAIDGAVRRERSGFAAVFSPWMTCEEAYLLASFLKSISKDVQLAIGPVRVVGEDDSYPKDIHGNAEPQTKFTIRAEKCPNRRGVEAVLQHFQGEVLSLQDLLVPIGSGEVSALYLVGGDPEFWISEKDASLFDELKLLIVQDILPSAAADRANYVLPGGSFAERDGTFVNHAGLAQAIQTSIVGPDEARPDGRILWELAGRRGLFHAPTLRKEIAAAIPALSGLAAGDLGDFGVFAANTPADTDSDKSLATPAAESR